MSLSDRHPAGDLCFATVGSPIGPLTVVTQGEVLTRILFADAGRPAAPPQGAREVWASSTAAVRQLEEYFRGDRTEFDLPLAPEGTPFQRRVWDELSKIPFGETRSYGQIADALGQPDAARAVGAANGQNPIPIVIPCHRVIGASGALVGFGGGLDTKRWLLHHERQRPLFPG